MATIKPIKAAGGVVAKDKVGQSPLVLLIFRRGIWDLPKGKLDHGESIRECAVREVQEEVGVEISPKISFDLPNTYHEYEQKGTSYGKTTYWFAMEFPVTGELHFTPQEEEDIQKVRWVSLDEAKQIVGYDNLKEVLRAFEERYKKSES